MKNLIWQVHLNMISRHTTMEVKNTAQITMCVQGCMFWLPKNPRDTQRHLYLSESAVNIIKLGLPEFLFIPLFLFPHFAMKWCVVAKRIRAPDSRSGVSYQQSVCSSPNQCLAQFKDTSVMTKNQTQTRSAADGQHQNLGLVNPLRHNMPQNTLRYLSD